jgi:hypothetical protein
VPSLNESRLRCRAIVRTDCVVAGADVAAAAFDAVAPKDPGTAPAAAIATTAIGVR